MMLGRRTPPTDADPTLAEIARREEAIRAAVPPGMRIAADWAWRILAVAAAFALLLFVIAELSEIVIPFLIAVLIASLLVPLVHFLTRHHWPKWLAVALAELGTLAVVAALIYLVVTQVARGFADLQTKSMDSYQQFKDFLQTGPLDLSDKELSGYIDQISEAIQKDSGILVSGALSVGTTAAHVATGFLLILFSTLFLLIDGKGVWNWVVRLFPKRARLAVDGAGHAGWVTLGNFVRVQIVVAFIDAVGIGLIAFFIGVPLAIPIAVLVFLGSFIPVVGSLVTGTLAVFIALVYNGPIPAVIMLAGVLLVQQIEGHILQPLIMGTAVKIHPLAVVLSVIGGGVLAGIPGTFFAVPVVATLNVMVKYIAQGRWRTNPRPSVEDVAPDA